MKKLAIVIVVLLGIGSMIWAGPSQESSGGVGKYALLMSHMTNAFVTTVSDAAKAEAAKQGIQLEVFDGKQDASVQISQIESCITQGYKGIIIEPVSADGVKPGILAAKKAGVPVITAIQRISNQEDVAAFVGGDEIAAGKLEMQKMIEAIGGKGNIAILVGPLGSEGQRTRREGYEQALKNYPDVKVVFEQTANWRTDEALRITENWLQTGQVIHAIVSQNDAMAVGAMKAVQDAKKSILISGVDVTPEGIAGIESGGILGSVSQDTPGFGTLSVQTIVKVVKGEKVPSVISTEAKWVTKENVVQFK
jgi:ribose transport system substrate-binding protein/inositol transport system substrate-binding protein